jgi:integrase
MIIAVLAASVKQPARKPGPYTAQRVEALVEEYRGVLLSQCVSKRYVRKTVERTRRVIREAGGDISKAGIEKALLSLSAGRKAITLDAYRASILAFFNWYSRPEVPVLPHTVTADHLERGLACLGDKAGANWSPGTLNAAVNALKTFGRWASDPVRGYLDRDPAQHLRWFDRSKDVRRRRSVFPPAALRRLVQMAESSDRVIHGVAGAERAALYLTVASTGLLPVDLQSLTANRFDLDRAEVRVGDDLVIPINPPDAADRLRSHIEALSPNQIAFPARPQSQLIAMLRADLSGAGIEYSRPIPEGEAAEGREVRDYVALRLTFCERGARIGVPLPVMQGWMRHSAATTTRDLYRRWLPPDEVDALRTVPPNWRWEGRANVATQLPPKPKRKPIKGAGGAARARDEAERLDYLQRYDRASTAPGFNFDRFLEDEGVDPPTHHKRMNWRTTREKRSGS